MARGRPKEFDREEALDKAVELFWEKTYEGVGVAELARHMGIGRQSLYDTYGNKEQLYLEALGRYVDQEVAPLNALLRREGSAMQNIQELFELFAERSRTHCYKGCLLVTTMVEHGPTGDRAAEVVRDRVLAIDAAFQRTFELAREQGDLADGVDPSAMAALMVAAMFGMATLGRLGIAEELMPRVGAALMAGLQPVG